MRSLAFLAAIFALVFGALLPSAVAASAAGGSPIMLCSGDQIMVAYDADGTPQPQKQAPADSLTCASCVLANLTTLPPPPEVRTAAPPRIVVVQPALLRVVERPSSIHPGLPPPSTAPPVS